MPIQRTLSPLCGLLAAAGLLTAASTARAQTPPAAKDATQEVIVTANKIATLASKTPLALSVVDGEQLKSEGVIDARALQDLSPSVQITQDTGRLQINIRGVMSINNTERGDPSNAFNIDGLYIGRPEAQFASFLDVERIEVLRGPQGTLYGRNATGGAINVISNKPGNKLGGKVALELGNYNAVRAEAAIDVPVSSALKLRAAVGANKRDSTLEGGGGFGLQDTDDAAARLHALLTFSPTTTLLLTGEYSKVNANGFTPVPMKAFFTGTPKGGNPTWPNDLLDPVWIGGNETAKQTVDPYYSRATFRDNENKGARAELRHGMGNVDLVYQLGYLSSSVSSSFIGPFNGFPFLGQSVTPGESEQLSHEVRLQSARPGPFTWVLGAFLYEEEIDRNLQYNTFINPNFTFRLKFQPHVENDAKAVFGQSSYALTPTLRLVTGARYSKDSKSAKDPFNGGGLTIPPAPIDRTVEFSQTTWKLGLDHDLSRDTFLYGSVSTGYKAGGFNTNTDTNVYKPERLTALELGIKTRALDNRLQLSASAFSYDYKDLQLTATVCTTNAQNVNVCGSRTVNAAAAKMRGVEVEGRLRPVSNGVLDFAVALNRSRFGNYKPIDRPVQAPNLVIDWTGQSLDMTPKSTVRVGYTHTIELPGGSALDVGVSARRNSGYLFSSYGDDYATRYRQPAFTKVDARVTWRSADDKYSVQAFVKNATDEITVVSRLPGALNIDDPRTFGIRLGATF